MSGQAKEPPTDSVMAEYQRKQAAHMEATLRRLEERDRTRQAPATDYVPPRQTNGSIDRDAYWAEHDADESARRQQEAWGEHQRERMASIQRMHSEMADLQRMASWDSTTKTIRRAITSSPRVHRSTRPTRITTSRRTTTMSSSARSSDADDGGGEPPGDPALDAEGRATGGASDDSGPWLTSVEEELLYREVAQQARRRSRYMREVRGTRRWWS
jgi:hypothetical protein